MTVADSTATSTDERLATILPTHVLGFRLVGTTSYDNVLNQTGGDVSVVASPVPNPAALLLFSTARIGLGLLTRHRLIG